MVKSSLQVSRVGRKELTLPALEHPKLAATIWWQDFLNDPGTNYLAHLDVIVNKSAPFISTIHIVLCVVYEDDSILVGIE